MSAVYFSRATLPSQAEENSGHLAASSLLAILQFGAVVLRMTQSGFILARHGFFFFLFLFPFFLSFFFGLAVHCDGRRVD